MGRNIPKYINVMGFDNEANDVVNRAIKLSDSHNCESVNCVHLFISLLYEERIGGVILEALGKKLEDFKSVYVQLAEEKLYGYFDSSNHKFSPDYFSMSMTNILGETSNSAFNEKKLVSTRQLYETLLRHSPLELEDYLYRIGLSIEDLENIAMNSFEIPEDLEDFLEDLCTSDKIMNQTIANVDDYTDEIIEVLSRKLKSNPCLIGEAGVGKTSVVNRLVQRIVAEEVPDNLKGYHVCYINGATLTAGTMFRGQFEERMKILIDWASDRNVILFLDEIHTFIDAGGSSSASTAGNMIKRALSDGSIKIIGATTPKEYHKFIEKDSAFNRRLQEVKISEPSEESAIQMIKNSIYDYEKYHGVRIPKKSVVSAVKYSSRYMKDSYLPDKAYTIIDQACASVKLSGRKVVETEDIVRTVSKITHIDINKINDEQADSLMRLEKIISKKLIGQTRAVNVVSSAIRRAKAGINEENKPLASFLFVGPTGVGKTELCKILSEEVALGEKSFIKIDMSEYSEKSSISKMIGSAPGYVGYGDGGQLTEKVKHNPYSIVLFDEIEKAHPEVYNIFLQLLDEGRLTDGEGSTVDFTKCIIVMTSNAGYGAESLSKKSLGFNSDNTEPSQREIEQKAMESLENTFRPEFLNRIDSLVIFEKLTKEQSIEVTKLMLDKLSKRISEQGIKVKFTRNLIESIASKGYSDKYGARNIRREIQDTVEDVIAYKILSKEIASGNNVTVGFSKGNVTVSV